MTEIRCAIRDSVRGFIVCYLTCYVLEAISGSYTSMNYQNIEREFQIPSKSIGMLSAAGKVGYISTVIFTGYFGGRGNRIIYIASGFTIVSAALILIASPKFIFST